MGKKRIIKIGEEQAVQESEKREEELVAKAKKKKNSRVIDRAKIYIKASYNNTTIHIMDSGGNMVAWSTAGGAGFKGPKKATPYAATQVVNLLMDKLERVEMKTVEIFVKGIGSGRDSAIRALAGRNLNIVAIKDITPIPHNGCRPPKRRRV